MGNNIFVSPSKQVSFLYHQVFHDDVSLKNP